MLSLRIGDIDTYSPRNRQATGMTSGVLLLNFGEPASPERDAVVDYLYRIFRANASLEEATSAKEANERARTLAERRADSLVEEYDQIGGSPLNAQAAAQAERLEAVLRNREFDATVYEGMQFTAPFIEDTVERAVSDGVERLIGLPAYPLCGPSTTVAALESMQAAVANTEWDGDIAEITGWHRHPAYNRLRVENTVEFVDSEAVTLPDPGTALVFSAHGTPQHYLDEGSRYQQYVEEYCWMQAGLLRVEDYHIGYQNHGNRDIPWTEPDVEAVIESLDAERVVIEPVSFIHEQSETLSELDDELREAADRHGINFYRVPIPHDDDRLPEVFADLVEPFVADIDPGYYNLKQCRCRDTPNTMCLNAETVSRDRPPTGTDGQIVNSGTDT